MYRPAIISIFLILIISACYRPAPRQAFDDLKILEGTWSSIEGPVFNEYWAVENDTLLKGIGFTLNNRDTSFKETLKIYRSGQNVFYAAKVGGNKNYVFFRMEEAGRGVWSFINPSYDYPNIIQYKMISDSLLETRTTNIRGNKEIKFLLKKVRE